jgi:hypothetical protein
LGLREELALHRESCRHHLAGTQWVLVQANFGGVLTIAGVPVGQALGRYYLKQELERTKETKPQIGTGQTESRTILPMVGNYCNCDGCAGRRAKSEEDGCSLDDGPGSNRIGCEQRERRLCDSLFVRA